MKFDTYGCIVMERDNWPGNIGDSCAETSRYAVLTGQSLPLSVFMTETGFVRHPTAPASAPGSGENWREPDFTSDQALPLLMGFDLGRQGYPTLLVLARAKIINMGMRTAPTKLASIGVRCLVSANLQLLAASQVAQALIFKIPWRWSDDQRIKSWWKLVPNEGQYADYLNYYVTAVYLRRRGVMWANVVLDREKSLQMVRNYYAGEPNHDWIIAAYEAART